MKFTKSAAEVLKFDFVNTRNVLFDGTIVAVDSYRSERDLVSVVVSHFPTAGNALNVAHDIPVIIGYSHRHDLDLVPLQDSLIGQRAGVFVELHQDHYKAVLGIMPEDQRLRHKNYYHTGELDDLREAWQKKV